MDFWTSVAIVGVMLIVGSVLLFGWFVLASVPGLFCLWAWHEFKLPTLETFEAETNEEWGL